MHHLLQVCEKQVEDALDAKFRVLKEDIVTLKDWKELRSEIKDRFSVTITLEDLDNNISQLKTEMQSGITRYCD